jgi:hypothetical protein
MFDFKNRFSYKILKTLFLTGRLLWLLCYLYLIKKKLFKKISRESSGKVSELNKGIKNFGIANTKNIKKFF